MMWRLAPTGQRCSPGASARLNTQYALNCQVTVLLDDFTEENGATAVVPGSQKLGRYPDVGDKLPDGTKRMNGEAGDAVIFFGMVWHCAMPNRSDHDRTGILIQYLPKFVKPMEDQLRGVRPKIVESATPLLRQLLGLDYPYPQVLEEANASVTEGRYANR